MTKMESLRKALDLQPHPEGGFFREVYRSDLTVAHPALNGASRSASTGIYFLLGEGDFSAFHVVRSDELWIHLDGGPLLLEIITPQGEHHTVRLGKDVANGEAPMALVPRDQYQAARPADGSIYTLCSCVVAPGFDFQDFAMPDRATMEKTFPELGEVIGRYCRG